MNFLKLSFQGLNEIWRYVIGTVAILFCYTVGQLPIELVKMYQFDHHMDLGVDEQTAFEKTYDFTIIHLSRNVGFMLLMGMFIFGMMGIFLTIRYLHRKEWLSIMTSRSKIDWSRVLVGFGIWFFIIIFFEMIQYAVDPNNYVITVDIIPQLGLLLICTILLPIQTSFEELLFRGYILQGIARHTGHVWVSILGSSLLFSGMHMMNPEVNEYGIMPMFFYYMTAGIFLSLLTILDEGLELALGVHWATNFVGALLFTYGGSVLQTDALFKSSRINVYVLILTFVIGAIGMLYLAYKKYHWVAFPDWNTRISNVDDKIVAEDPKQFGQNQYLES